MNLLGKTYKVVSWILFGKDKTKIKWVLKYAEALMKNIEVKASNDGVVVRYVKKI